LKNSGVEALRPAAPDRNVSFFLFCAIAFALPCSVKGITKQVVGPYKVKEQVHASTLQERVQNVGQIVACPTTPNTGEETTRTQAVLSVRGYVYRTV
jgi:hypothetical protein